MRFGYHWIGFKARLRDWWRGRSEERWTLLASFLATAAALIAAAVLA